MQEYDLLIQEKYYLIVDFEATCTNRNEFPRDEMEIIEIGALLLDSEQFEIHSEFQSFIKPVRNPLLTGFCKELTTIRQDRPSVRASTGRPTGESRGRRQRSLRPRRWPRIPPRVFPRRLGIPSSGTPWPTSPSR